MRPDEFTKSIRKDFPLIFERNDIAYLDSAATMQKPESVIRAVKYFYEKENANPLRGLYSLGVDATEEYENARETVRKFINAASVSEIVFTRNATESLNLVGYSWASQFLKEGDEIAITIMEHHSDLLPWQIAAKKTGAVLKYIECDSEGRITDQDFDRVVTDRTKLVCMTMVSNVLGVSNDVKHFAKKAHDKGALFLADGAQSIPHVKVDVRDLGVDFLVFSGHKMGAPMGIGVLYGKENVLDKMPPFLYGGEMIEYVTRESATFAELPHKFEAGTVNAGGAVGLMEAIRYYASVGFDNIIEAERTLSEYAYGKLTHVPHLNLLGAKNAKEHNGIFTFPIDDVHPHDIAARLESDGICVRAGHHCAQPLLKFMGVSSTARASLAFYNTTGEIDRLADSVSRIRERMGYDR